MKKWIIPVLVSIAVFLTACSEDTSEQEKEDPEKAAPKETEVSEKEEPDLPASAGDRKVSEDGSMIEVEEPERIDVIVNKQRKLPDGYEPPDLTEPDVPFSFEEFHPKKQMREEAARALEALFEAAEEDGLDLVAASGYRSYERQKTIYENSVAENGEEYANRYSAKPGTSEHQTGLAMDVTSAEMAFRLEQSFIETDEGSWLEENAHRFGFVIRYPEGKTDITGYAYEPWHLRYIGEKLAAEVHEQEETLEEFFGLYPTN
ncbi:M15 family metallopeptidase [Salimicrobium halophilum]|uniref:D-alanyl-D-alanine carboxypeptidase n=1 Tax=Salimicrobium halophilum TaxID=86666 RepID=A0A1G8TM24_9BACI|nr:M15 family metallopeptidase [Salimicrobium halophilum]SDJ42477.1 D-alanyl-D-alanine carboxypeptidase [Salimicrobium halophilum]